MLHLIPGKGMVEIPPEVIGVYSIKKMIPGKVYYGPPKPDVALVYVKMKDLPCLKVKYNKEKIKEGREIATAGFPMGTDTLMAPGYLHQITPTLRKGIISAVLPFECNTPHALMIDIMTQGGASGSPVFFPDSDEIVGVLNAGLNDHQRTTVILPKDKNELDPSLHSHFYKLPTNMSYVVPSHYIEHMLKKHKLTLPADTPSLTDILNKSEFIEHTRGEKREYTLWDKKGE
jgi:hypothetical protein